jgi:AcrR family transcriptional regulator
MRACSDREKEEKAIFILQNAHRLFEQEDYAAITMARIAKESGVAKGTVFNYYPTKEELFLKLAGTYFQQLFDNLTFEIEERINKNTPENLTEILVKVLLNNPSFLKIIPLLNSIIEKNVSVGNLKIFKSQLLENIILGGTLLEKYFPLIPQNQGPRFLIWVYGILIGFINLADPEENAKEIIEQNQMELFHFSLKNEITNILLLIIKGF